MDEKGYTWTRLDGSMNTRERNAVIAQFQDSSPDSPRVLLLSLRAGISFLLQFMIYQSILHYSNYGHRFGGTQISLAWT